MIPKKSITIIIGTHMRGKYNNLERKRKIEQMKLRKENRSEKQGRK